MSWMTGWILSGLRLSLPLVFAAYGGMLSERAGVANIALEAYLLSSSFTAAAVMAVTDFRHHLVRQGRPIKKAIRRCRAPGRAARRRHPSWRPRRWRADA